MRKSLSIRVLVGAVSCSCVLLTMSFLGRSDSKDLASYSNLKIAYVNVKECVEASKIGKQEIARFENLKKQLETAIDEKEKELNEMSPKFNDEYLDTLTPEAEAELKENFKNASNELSQRQNQYYYVLGQANTQVEQKMAEAIRAASNKFAKDLGIDVVLNEDACFYANTKLDISAEIVKEMDLVFEKDQQKSSKE